MFELFTHGARVMAVTAREEARRLGHMSIDTVHLLMACLRADEVYVGEEEPHPRLSAMLAALGVSAADLYVPIASEFSAVANPSDAFLAFTEGTKEALKLSLQESIDLGHSYIGIVHIMLGILRQGGEEHRLAAHVGLAELHDMAASQLPARLATPEPAPTPPPLGEILPPPPQPEPVLEPQDPPAAEVSDAIREAQVLALFEATSFGHGYVGTEHLLLALFEIEDESETEPADLLPRDWTVERVRRRISALSGYILESDACPRETHEVQQAYALAYAFAQRLPELRVRPLHVLAAMASLRGSMARSLMIELGFAAEAARLVPAHAADDVALSVIGAELEAREGVPPLPNRHVPPFHMLRDSVAPPGPAWTSYSDNARRAVVAARREARALGHAYVRAEHGFLSLLSVGGPAAQLLADFGIDGEAARTVVAEVIPADPQRGERVPMDVRLRAAWGRSAPAEARRLGDDQVRSGHVLLALLRSSDYAQLGAILARLGADASELRAQLMSLMRGSRHDRPRRRVAASGSTAPRSVHEWARAHAVSLVPAPSPAPPEAGPQPAEAGSSTG